MEEEEEEEEEENSNDKKKEELKQEIPSFKILRQSKKVVDIKLLGKEKSPIKVSEKESPKRSRYERKEEPIKEESKEKKFDILRTSRKCKNI